jgi:hypothetical protein
MTAALWSRVDAGEAAMVQRYLNTFPVKVGELAEELGLKVVRAPLQPKISGLIQPSPDARSGFQIKVNKYEVPERQRFTVAHEIAHFLLHRGDIGAGVVDSIMYRSSLTSRKETEANRLAAEIIMPANEVARELRRLGGVRTDSVAEELAAIFRVSVPAMKVRLGVA